MKERWTKEQAWEWYNAIPWIRGFNYVASDCVNRQEQWQDFEHDKKEETFEREFALAEKYGFNAIRSVLPFEPWYYEHDKFMKHLDDFLTIAHRHGLGVMIVFGNDCTVSKADYVAPKFGPQPIDMGYHGGIARSPHGLHTEAGYSLLDEPELCEAWTRMVAEIVGKYAHDERVQIWDIFNEPGNGRRGSMSLRAMEGFFAAARAQDPDQPLTAGAWTVSIEGKPLPEIQQRAMELSDIISYHDYRGYEASVRIIDILKREGRPMVNTEWLHRIQNNNVQTHLPLFYLEKIGCYNWGFVAGKSQTYEPWEAIWARYEAGTQKDVDFTKWQHDLFRINLRPYDPRELDVFVRFGKLADEKFAREQAQKAETLS